MKIDIDDWGKKSSPKIPEKKIPVAVDPQILQNNSPGDEPGQSSKKVKKSTAAKPQKTETPTSTPISSNIPISILRKLKRVVLSEKGRYVNSTDKNGKKNRHSSRLEMLQDLWEFFNLESISLEMTMDE